MAAAISPMGADSAAAASKARKNRNRGLSSLPIHVMIEAGRREKNSTAAKNSAEKRHSAALLCTPTSGWMPTLKETVAVRGMANSGPMARYSRLVKK